MPNLCLVWSDETQRIVVHKLTSDDLYNMPFMVEKLLDQNNLLDLYQSAVYDISLSIVKK